MDRLRRLAVLLLLVPAASNAHADEAGPLNDTIMSLIDEYPDKGFGGYAWPARPGTHGTTRDLFQGKTRIARFGDGNHCVGITFEVMWRALSTRPTARNRLTSKQARRLRSLWFVPSEGGMGPAEALPEYGLGIRITDWDKARAGDFIQVWTKDRSLGHSAVFVAWVRDDNKRIVGVRYWSSQPWTDGIGFSDFTIGQKPGDMDPASVFIARLKPRRY